MMKIAAFLLVALVSVNGQVVNWGWCPQVTPQSPLNFTMFTGKWYEVGKLNGDAAEKCVTHTFDDTQNIYAINRVMYDEVAPVVESSFAFESDTTRTSFEATPQTSLVRMPIKYTIVETDYETYAIIHTCNDILFSNIQQLWVLSRTRPAPETIDTTIKTVLEKNNLWHMNSLTKTNQTSCDN